MRIIVTGTTSGIGEALARRLAPIHELFLLGRSSEKIALLCGEIGGEWYCVDFSASPREIAEIASKLVRLGRIDAFVHCAGAYEGKDLLRVNAAAPFELIRELRRNLVGGTVVVVNSSVVFSPAVSGSTADYADSKRLLKRMTDNFRTEVNAANIRVTSIYPGRTATPMQRRISMLEGKNYRPELLLQPGDVAELIEAVILLPRTAEVVDLHVRPMKKP